MHPYVVDRMVQERQAELSRLSQLARRSHVERRRRRRMGRLLTALAAAVPARELPPAPGRVVVNSGGE